MSESRSYLGRIFDVLDRVVEADSPVTATQVAVDGGMPVSSVARLTTLLIDRGMIHRLPSGALVPGSHLVHLGLRAVTRTANSTELESMVRRVARLVPESISAGLLVGDEIVLVARQEPDFALRIVAKVGDVVAPHTSAMGKAIMAGLPEERQLSVLAKATGDPAGARDLLDGLRDELRDVHDHGFARDEGDYSVGQRCRAVPLHELRHGVFGALSVAGPAARFTYADAEATVPTLKEAAVGDHPEQENLVAV
jgi:IclR family acetate operon transcriptional repressor